jgi:hypothetical protein
VSQVWCGYDTKDRADIDDAPFAALTHRRQHRVGHPDDAEQIDVEQGLHLGDRGLLRAADQTDTGVVDQQVDPSGLRENARNECVDGTVVGHVAGQHGYAFRAIFDRAATCAEDSESRLRQGLGAGAADARGGSCDERDAKIGFVHNRFSFSFGVE